jgi:hypothetical protein
MKYQKMPGRIHRNDTGIIGLFSIGKNCFRNSCALPNPVYVEQDSQLKPDTEVDPTWMTIFMCSFFS